MSSTQTVAKPESLVPVPDPTTLTTQLLTREVACLREIIEARLDGMDKAIELLQRATDRHPAEITAAVDQLQELHEEKFGSIQTQFSERDTRTESTARDSKIAIDAALQAAKEAVGKTEISFTKQIDAIGNLINATAVAVNDKIDDVKGRLNAIEGRSKGIGDVVGYIVGAAGLLVAIVTVFLSMRGATP